MSIHGITLARCYSPVNSKLRIAQLAASCYALRMDVKEIRAANLKRYIRDLAGNNQRQFADAYGLNAAHVSQMCTRHRDIGDKIARKIEVALRLGHGAMDRLPDGLSVDAEQVGRDWLMLAEPMKTFYRDAIRGAADQSRKMGPAATDEYVATHIEPSPEAKARKGAKK